MLQNGLGGKLTLCRGQVWVFPSGAGCSPCPYTPASKYLPGLDESPKAGASSVSQVGELWPRSGGEAYLSVGPESHWATVPPCSSQSTDCPHRLGPLQPWSRWHETPDIASTQYLLGTHTKAPNWRVSSTTPPGGQQKGGSQNESPPHTYPNSSHGAKKAVTVCAAEESPPCEALEPYFWILILPKA